MTNDFTKTINIRYPSDDMNGKMIYFFKSTCILVNTKMLRGRRDRDRKAPVNSVPIAKKLSNSIPDHGKGIYSIPFFGQDFQ